MTAATWLETRLALTGTLRLARGDPGGLSCFVTSLDGFWRSFRAAVICYPFYLLLLSMRVTTAQAEASDAVSIVVAETIGYTISWVAYPLLILPLTRWLGREQYFLRFMVAYNWCQVPQTGLFVVLGLIGASGMLPAGAAQFAELAGAIAVLAYEWTIARFALALPGGPAALVILVDVVLGTLLSQISEALY